MSKRRVQVIIVFIDVSFEDLTDYIAYIQYFRHCSANLLKVKNESKATCFGAIWILYFEVISVVRCII